MNERVLLQRRRINATNKRCAILKDFTVRFDLPGGFATIFPEKDAEVHGVCYDVPAFPDFGRLCASEAVPIAYYPIEVELTLYGTERATCKAFTLRSPPFPQAPLPLPSVLLRPSDRYLNLIEQGAREAGISSEYLNSLLQNAKAIGGKRG